MVPGMRMVFALTALLMALTSSADVATAQYTCKVSGEVSAACCCTPASGDGCPAIERPCTCCDVSYTQATSGAGQPVTLAQPTQVRHLLSFPILPALKPLFQISSAVCPRDSSRISTRAPSIYIANAALLR